MKTINLKSFRKKRNWFLASNANFLIPISLEQDCVNQWYFKLWLYFINQNLEYIKGLLYIRRQRNKDYKIKVWGEYSIINSGSNQVQLYSTAITDYVFRTKTQLNSMRRNRMPLVSSDWSVYFFSFKKIFKKSGYFSWKEKFQILQMKNVERI